MALLLLFLLVRKRAAAVLFHRCAVLMWRERRAFFVAVIVPHALVSAPGIVGNFVLFVFLFRAHRLVVSPPRVLGKRSHRVIFANRSDAGRQLAAKLAAYSGPDTRVLALPRGGVPVAHEVAQALGVPLDVFIVRKLGAPGREELAIGAIASGGVKVLNRETIEELGVSDAAIAEVVQREEAELRRREVLYRGGLPAQDVAGRTVLLIDDGLATGASMYAAILALRARSPARIIVAVPVAPADTVMQLQPYADDVVVIAMPRPFRGVGAWYADFTQTTDEEVREMLHA